MNRNQKLEFIIGVKNGTRSISELEAPIDLSNLLDSELRELIRIQDKYKANIALTVDENEFLTNLALMID